MLLDKIKIHLGIQAQPLAKQAYLVSQINSKTQILYLAVEFQLKQLEAYLVNQLPHLLLGKHHYSVKIIQLNQILPLYLEPNLLKQVQEVFLVKILSPLRHYLDNLKQLLYFLQLALSPQPAYLIQMQLLLSLELSQLYLDFSLHLSPRLAFLVNHRLYISLPS